MQASAAPVPVPAQAPAAPSVPATQGAADGARVIGVEGMPGAALVLRGAREQRRELRNQLEGLEQKRRELRNELEQTANSPDARAGVLARLKEIDGRILATDALIGKADEAVAAAASVPGATIEPPEPPRSGPPEEAIIMGGLVMLAAVFPLSIAYARRIWKRGATIIAPVPREVQDRLDGLSHAVESIGLEVERIGEGQRFITKVMAGDHTPAVASLHAGGAARRD